MFPFLFLLYVTFLMSFRGLQICIQILVPNRVWVSQQELGISSRYKVVLYVVQGLNYKFKSATVTKQCKISSIPISFLLHQVLKNQPDYLIMATELAALT
ncbi:hypothetical protein L1887_03642 [Cichorium endivia]|nr:hypothetical protein L1887_03642 [Cichorium endivia]